MREEEIIEQLKSLKSIQPDSSVLMGVKKDIHSHLKIGKSDSVCDKVKSYSNHIFPLFKTNPFASYSIVIALFVVILLSIYSGFLPNTMNKVLLYSRIVTAPNQYIKASIALSYAQDKINTLNANKLDENKTKDISQSIAFANTELSGLKLLGETGIYTSEQCKELYRSYYASLENLDKSTTANSPNDKDNQALASLKVKISGYKKQAEQKLNRYK